VKRASNGTLAGRRYLDLQREAKRTRRPTDELIQQYALECFLDRLVHSKFAETFILKGGVLLATLDARRLRTRSLPRVQLAGIVTMGAWAVSVTSANAMRSCTTVNAYLESKSESSIQNCEERYRIDA
jgi:hypothetical protein